MLRRRDYNHRSVSMVYIPISSLDMIINDETILKFDILRFGIGICGAAQSYSQNGNATLLSMMLNTFVCRKVYLHRSIRK